MSIVCYWGVMGSGKTYECVSSVIIPAVAVGRRVVSNIDGLDADKIKEYVSEKFNINYHDTGDIVYCCHSDIEKPDFFPTSQESQSFVKPGDLVCIDEAYRFWGTGEKYPKEHKIFFREHRHFTDEKGICCDLALMSQSIRDFPRFLVDVIEFNFQCKKLKMLGFPSSYRVLKFEGKERKSSSAPEIHNYNPEIFPLYKSYSAGAGVELKIDKRQKFIKKHWVVIFCLLPFFTIYAVIKFMSFFNPERHVKSSSISPSRPALSAPKLSPASVVSVSKWRILGIINSNKMRWVVLVNEKGALRFESPSRFSGYGSMLSGEIDGETVSYFSGDFGSEKKDRKGMFPL